MVPASGPRASARHALRSGRGRVLRIPRVEGIEGLEPIRRGGFATVYRTRQPTFGRDVAVEVLNASGTDTENRRRFERECQVLGTLSGHPGIVPVHDAGFTADGRVPGDAAPSRRHPAGSARQRSAPVDRGGRVGRTARRRIRNGAPGWSTATPNPATSCPHSSANSSPTSASHVSRAPMRRLTAS